MKKAAKAATPAVDHHTFAALSDPVRLSVVGLLRERPYRAGELAQALAMTAPALSRHLKVLRKSGLIVDDTVDEDARVRLYRLRPEAFADLRDWLSEVESFWEDQLASLQAHAQAASNTRRR